jgi:hypothetical protein
MFNPLNYPFLVLVMSLAVFWIAARIGTFFHTRQKNSDANTLDDFKLLLGATLTLLGLIVGFTFSMAVSRYDQRKNLEEEEANAIGTEYARADLLPASEAVSLGNALKSYLDQRILFYTNWNAAQLQQINAQTGKIQSEMWSMVVASASQQPTPVRALVVSGMNDVLNSQGYTQAAWWNRIPSAGWTLVIIIGMFCNVLVGYVAQGRSSLLLWILPVALAISLFLIADIDSPGHGVIRVVPQNLQSLATSLSSH